VGSWSLLHYLGGAFVKNANRYCVLTAAMVIQFCAGIIYGWSVFKGPVAAYLEWDAGSAALTSSVMLAMFVIGIIAGGYAQDKLGPRNITLVGSICIGAGMAATALVNSSAPRLVYITYGVIAGLGVGTVYMSTVAAVQKWFPDRRGFASGMTVCAFGFSLVVLAPLAKSMLNGLGVALTFLILGAAFLIICAVSSLFISNPPSGYMPTGFVTARAAQTVKQYAPGEIIKTKQFYLIAGALFFTLPAYFMLNPVFISLGADRGLSERLAVIGVSLTGISSASGRLIVSWASDKIGRKAAMVVIAAIILAASLVMIKGENVLFLICIILISFGFGGAAGVYATVTAENFGTKFGGINFGLIMIGFGASALVFQNISHKLTAGGSYESSFILAAATCAIAIVLILMLKNPNINTIKKTAHRKG
jgi:OFA family oxalate/formate antiporter-like MFS transporter